MSVAALITSPARVALTVENTFTEASETETPTSAPPPVIEITRIERLVRSIGFEELFPKLPSSAPVRSVSVSSTGVEPAVARILMSRPADSFAPSPTEASTLEYSTATATPAPTAAYAPPVIVPAKRSATSVSVAVTVMSRFELIIVFAPTMAVVASSGA